MTDVKEIRIAQDFSKYPLGRFPKHSDACGQNFREKMLVPALENYEHVRVFLDGIEGEYGSSFLDESFAGLILKCDFHATEILSRIEIVTTSEDLKLEIERYIREAGARTPR